MVDEPPSSEKRLDYTITRINPYYMHSTGRQRYLWLLLEKKSDTDGIVHRKKRDIETL